MPPMNTSSINFEAAYSNAELRVAADALRHWLENHPELTFFTFDQVCRELANSAPFELFNRVLLRLVAAGELQVHYRVKLGGGEYSEEAFESLDDVPPCVFDSSFEPVEVSDEDKVTAYAHAR
jgi:hypothetical protein